VTDDPKAVQLWVTMKMEDLDLFQAALEDQNFTKLIDKSLPAKPNNRKLIKHKKIRANPLQSELKLTERTKFLAGIKEDYKLVEINQGLRDSLLDSMATMADLDNPTIEESLEQHVKDALENFKKDLKTPKQEN